jgi:hypothetical protein
VDRLIGQVAGEEAGQPAGKGREVGAEPLEDRRGRDHASLERHVSIDKTARYLLQLVVERLGDGRGARAGTNALRS